MIKTASQIAFSLLFTLLFACGGGETASTDDSTPAAEDDGRQAVDLIVLGDHVVTMNDAGQAIPNGAVAISEGVIVSIGPRSDVETLYRATATLGGEGKVVMPGLVNGHSHAAMTLLRGVADDLALMDWLNNYIFPAEVQFVDAEFVRIGTELACWEMIRGGTTTFVDMYYYPDVIAEVVESCGLRAYVSATVIDQRSPDAESAADSLQKGRAFIERWQGRSSRITPVFGPHANYTLNAEQLAATREAADEFGVPITIHMSESPFELQYSQDTYGTTTIRLMDSLGFLDGPTIGAHVVWPTPEEISILAERQVGVIHNPTSNMKIASGIAPVTAMIDAGVRVGLGTDGAASNNDLDMWEEMRLAAFLQKVEQMNPEALPAKTVLNMATRGGAQAIGLGDSIGRLEAGFAADLITIDYSDVHHVPSYDVISHLVYVTDEQDVSSVVVDGRVLMRERELLTIDTERVAGEARELASRIQAVLEARN